MLHVRWKRKGGITRESCCRNGSQNQRLVVQLIIYEYRIWSTHTCTLKVEFGEGKVFERLLWNYSENRKSKKIPYGEWYQFSNEYSLDVSSPPGPEKIVNVQSVFLETYPFKWIDVCMYVYVCICAYVCMYVYMCVYVCVCMYVCVYVFMDVWMDECVRIFVCIVLKNAWILFRL